MKLGSGSSAVQFRTPTDTRLELRGPAAGADRGTPPPPGRKATDGSGGLNARLAQQWAPGKPSPSGDDGGVVKYIGFVS